MDKKVIIGILLGFSIHLLFGNYLRYMDGSMDKLYIRTGIAALIFIGLYIKEFRIKKNILPSFYASIPYFIALCLIINIDSSISPPLGILLIFWNIVGG